MSKVKSLTAYTGRTWKFDIYDSLILVDLPLTNLFLITKSSMRPLLTISLDKTKLSFKRNTNNKPQSRTLGNCTLPNIIIGREKSLHVLPKQQVLPLVHSTIICPVITQEVIKSRVMTSSPSPVSPIMGLKWDGSCLGRWRDLRVLSKISGAHGVYYQIVIAGLTFITLIKITTSPFACIVDEIKPYFGLQKQGTHWVKRGEQTIILIRVPNDGIVISEYPTLTDFRNQRRARYPKMGLKEQLPVLTNHIQRNFVFRLIMGIRKLDNGSLVIRWTGMESGGSPNHQLSNDLADTHQIEGTIAWYVISISETRAIEVGETSQLPDIIMKEWFSAITIEEIAREMCRVQEYNQINTFVHLFTSYIEDVINRVDRHLITLVKDIVYKLTTILTADLDPQLPVRRGVLGPPPQSQTSYMSNIITDTRL